MNIIYIFGITILLTGGTDSLIEDTKTDKRQQRILLRKLQNFQDVKPLTWNEVLADVLVNKIRIFSFKNQDKEDVVKEDAPVSNERTGLTDFFSKVFVVYKKFIYDAFVGKREENDDELTMNTVPLNPKSDEDENRKIESEEANKPNEITFTNGPKSEVELVEPKYHGKIALEESTTENPDEDSVDVSKKDNSDDKKDAADPVIEISDDSKLDVNTNKEESVKCGAGFMKAANGNCVNSRLILAIPYQCPIGYRQDKLGYCRMIFNF